MVVTVSLSLSQPKAIKATENCIASPERISPSNFFLVYHLYIFSLRFIYLGMPGGFER